MPEPAQTLTIAGREFKAITNSTLEHDLWTFKQINLCGLQNATVEEGEDPDEFVRRVMLQVTAAGEIFLVLGGLLMPAEADSTAWTPEMAAETGRFLASVTAPEDKALVRQQIAGAMASFLAQGLLFMRSSRRSSTSATPAPEPEPSTSGEPDSTENGPASSARSRATIPTA